MPHIPTASYPVCPICREHIELETAGTDDRGRAVHEQCYAAKLSSNDTVGQDQGSAV